MKMIVVRFRNNEEHEDLLKKVRKMQKFTDELEDMLKECYEEEEGYSWWDDFSYEEEDYEFRGGSGGYRKHWDDGGEAEMRGGRYGYRRGGRRM